MNIRFLLAGIIALLAPASAVATEPPTLDIRGELLNNAGKGDFAPYYFTANRHGILTQSAGVTADISAVKPLDTSRRFSWGAGVEAFGGWNEKTLYQRFDAASGWSEHSLNGSHAALAQLYGEVKFRGVFLTAGLKHRSSAMLDSELSSGDLIESGNARALPEVRVGFIDFQNIPFTNGWVQIQGEFGYGAYCDYGWLKDHYNYYSWHITDGSLNNYKRCYFRTKPSERFSVTVGAQCVTVFGGTEYTYKKGVLTRTDYFSRKPRAFIEAFLPISEGLEDFRLGNTLGSWDLMARYDLREAGMVKAYFQWPWEDGSGIGRRNGFDGLWGLEYSRPGKGRITGAVLEYIDFTNQGGPLHWAPGDKPGTTITGQATGADDYYNNAFYNSYANYGMAIGTPFVKSPIFNTDGNMTFLHTKTRGFHAAVKGYLTDRLSYRAMVSYRKAWGNGPVPVVDPLHSTSLMLEASYDVSQLPGLGIKAAFALDNGTLFGNNSGAMIALSYSFGVKLGKQRHN